MYFLHKEQMQLVVTAVFPRANKATSDVTPERQ